MFPSFHVLAEPNPTNYVSVGFTVPIHSQYNTLTIPTQSETSFRKLKHTRKNEKGSFIGTPAADRMPCLLRRHFGVKMKL